MEIILNEYYRNNMVFSFNSANTEGVFAEICSNAPFIITLMTQTPRFSDMRGRNFETWIFQHNINMNNPVSDNSFTIARETNNIKGLNIGVKKCNGKYYLYATKFSGVAFIIFIEGKQTDNIIPLQNEEIPIGSYEIVMKESFNKYIVDNSYKPQNLEAGTILYDKDAQNIKFNRYGIANYSEEAGYWFYPEEKHVRGEYKAGTIFEVAYIPNTNISSIIIRNSNNYSLPEGDTLNISARQYYSDSSTVYQVYAVLHNLVNKTHNIKLYRDTQHVYLQLLETSYLYFDRAYKIVDKLPSSITEIPIVYTLGSKENRPTIYSWNPLLKWIGFQYFDTTLNKPIYWNGTKWVGLDGNDVDATPATSGTFAKKPTGVDVGYAYFCTDKQTTEGTTNGIMIYYKGDNVWVDALGRAVS